MKKVVKCRKFIVVLLAITMIFTVFTVPASAKGFSDIPSGYKYLDAVNYVSDNQIMEGTTTTKFSPGATVTRGMIVTVLYRKAGSPNVTAPNKFTDVSSDKYYYKAVIWAEQQGIAKGKDETTFAPNDNVTRQDASLFLYRFSLKTKTSVNKMTSITGYPDYSNVTAYAREGMQWAMGNKVYETINGNLSPKTFMTREQLALAITKFGTNVERIISGRNNLGFTNSSSNFTKSWHYMMSQHYAQLESVVRSSVPSSQVESTLKLFRDRRDATWGGSCYGMSVVAIFDKMGRIAFNENYDGAKELYGIPGNRPGGIVESAINYYQLSQFLAAYGQGGLDPATAMKYCMNAEGPTLFSFWWNEDGKTPGHTIIVNSCEKSGSTYKMEVINPNSKSAQTMTITGKTLTLGGKEHSLTNCYAMNIWGQLNKWDIDGYTNVAAIRVSEDSLEDSSIPEDDTPIMDKPYSTLCVDLTGEFTIKNDSGESVHWDGSTLSGDLEIYDMKMTTNGPESPGSMILMVPVSETYTFETNVSEKETWFCVADEYRYARVKGTNLEEIAIEKDGIVKLQCNSAEVEIAYSSVEKDAPMRIIRGIASGEVIADGDADLTTAIGLVGQCTLCEVDSEGNSKQLEEEYVTPPTDESSVIEPSEVESSTVESSEAESSEVTKSN